MKKFWIVNKINPGTAEILLYGYINEYDCSAQDFIIELSQLVNLYDTILIRINSGGGSVFEGIAIYNAIKQLQKNGKNISTNVDGIAASMGSVIAIAGSPCRISKYGRMMTHEASGGAFGTVDEMKQQIQLIEDVQKDLVQIFAVRTGLSEDQVNAKFFQKGVDKWMNASQCIENGLADEVYDADPVQVPENVKDVKQVCNLFDTILNKHIPQSNNDNMNKIIAKMLGLPEDASDSQIEAALKKVLDEKKAADDAVATQARTRAEDLVNNHSVAKGYPEAKRKSLIENAVLNYDATKEMLEMLAPVKKPTEIINRTTQEVGADNNDEVPAITGKKGEGWDNLVAKGIDAVAACKKDQPAIYAQLYKDKYDREPSAMGRVRE